MRRFVAAAAFLFSQTLALSALAQGISANVQTGRIVFLDSASMSFTVRSANATQQYWATRATRFRARRPNVSFFDLATGQSVVVTSHDSGRLAIADDVTFER